MSNLEDYAADRMGRKKKGRGALNMQRRTAKLDVIPPECWEFEVLKIPAEDVDFSRFALPDFQREEIKSWVGILADALRRGAATPPIDVAVRPNEPEPRQLWIIDGQQRFWAHVDALKPITCHVHEIEKREYEKTMFIALNNRRLVSGNLIIACHLGPITMKVLTPANEDRDSPLHGRISFTSSVRKDQVSASTLIRALGRLVGATGNVQAILTRLDVAIDKKGAIRKFQHFLWLVGSIFFLPSPGTQPGAAEICSLAIAWRDSGFAEPGIGALTRLRKVASRLHAVVAATVGERELLIGRKFGVVFRPSAKLSAA